jgi:hypothetical protein
MTFHALLVAGDPESGLVAFRRDATADTPIRAGMTVECVIRRGLTTPAYVMDVTLGWDPVMVLWLDEPVDSATVDLLWTLDGWEPVQVLSDMPEGAHRFYSAPASPQDEPLLVLPTWAVKTPSTEPVAGLPRIGFSRPAQAVSPHPSIAYRSLNLSRYTDLITTDMQTVDDTDGTDNVYSLEEWRTNRSPDR